MKKYNKSSLYIRLKFTIQNLNKIKKIAFLIKKIDEKDVKSVWQIYCDLIAWSVKYKTINKFYYYFQLYKKDRKIADYLPYSEFRIMRDGFNAKKSENKKFNYLCLLRDKYLFEMIMQNLNIPTPRNSYYWNSCEEIKDLLNKKNISFDELLTKSFDGFLKSVSGEEGDGVFAIEISNNKILLDNKNISLLNLKNQFNGSYILQKRIIQHKQIAKIYSGSVNTIRIITFFHKNKIEVFDSFLRIGVDGINKDNLSQGGILVAIDFKTAKLEEKGYIRNNLLLKTVTEHPDTKVSFDGYKIPFYTEAVDLVKKAHAGIGKIHSIGWDVAITESGPELLEGNDNWSILSPQTHRNYGIRKEISKFYN